MCSLPKGDALSLPKGWEVKKLGEVITLEYGKPLDKYKRIDKGQYPVYGANGIKAKTNEYYYDKKTIIVGRKGSAGEINLTEERFWPLDVSYFVKFEKKQIDLYFLYFWLSKLNLPKLAKGVKPGINRNDVYDLAIPLPPLPEQKRIVAILEQAFTAIDQARSNTEKNLKNARELFQSKLQETFDNGKLKIDSGEWQEKKLGEVASVEYGYTDQSTMKGDYRYIRITDIDQNGELIITNKKYIKYSKGIERFVLDDNDLLMARTGATFAKVLLYKDYEISVFASYLIKIKFTEKIENALYWYFAKTRDYWQQANTLSSGAAQPHFNGGALKKVIFTYPKSVSKQKLLIQKFKNLSTETKKLEAIYQRKIACLDELKKSLLQKAFNGGL